MEPDDLDAHAVEGDRELHQRDARPPPGEEAAEHDERDKCEVDDEHHVGRGTPQHFSIVPPCSRVVTVTRVHADRVRMGNVHG